MNTFTDTLTTPDKKKEFEDVSSDFDAFLNNPNIKNKSKKDVKGGTKGFLESFQKLLKNLDQGEDNGDAKNAVNKSLKDTLEYVSNLDESVEYKWWISRFFLGP